MAGMGGSMGGANEMNGMSVVQSNPPVGGGAALMFGQAQQALGDDKPAAYAPTLAPALGPTANPFYSSWDVGSTTAPAPQPALPAPTAPSTQMPSALSPRNGRNLQNDFSSAPTPTPAPGSTAGEIATPEAAAAAALAARLKNASLGASFASNSDKVPTPTSSNGSFIILAKSGFVLGMAAGQISTAGSFPPKGATAGSIVMTTSTRNGSVEMVSYGKASADMAAATERASVAAAAKVGAFEPAKAPRATTAVAVVPTLTPAPAPAKVPVSVSPPLSLVAPLQAAFSVASLASLGRRSDGDDLSRVDLLEMADPDPLPDEPVRPAPTPMPALSNDPTSLVPYVSLLPKMDIRKLNGQLDGDNERAPNFKPGSVLDSDWTHKVNELGNGLENSFGYVLDDNGRLQRLMVSASQFRGLGGGPPATAAAAPGAVAPLQLPARDAGPAAAGGMYTDSIQLVREASPTKLGSMTSMAIPPFQGGAGKVGGFRQQQMQVVGGGGNSWAMAPFAFGQQPPRKTSSLSRPSKSVLKKNFVIAQPGPQNLFIDGRVLKKVMPPAQAVPSPTAASPRTKPSKRVVWGEGCVVAVLNLNTVALDDTFVANPNEPVSPMERLPLRESDLQPSPVQVSLNAKFWDALSRQEQLENANGSGSQQQRSQQDVQPQGQASIARQQEQAASAERARLFAAKQRELDAGKQQVGLAKDKAKAKADDRDLPATGWVEYYSAEHKRNYYFCHETGESRW